MADSNRRPLACQARAGAFSACSPAHFEIDPRSSVCLLRPCSVGVIECLLEYHPPASRANSFVTFARTHRLALGAEPGARRAGRQHQSLTVFLSAGVLATMSASTSTAACAAGSCEWRYSRVVTTGLEWPRIAATVATGMPAATKVEPKSCLSPCSVREAPALAQIRSMRDTGCAARAGFPW